MWEEQLLAQGGSLPTCGDVQGDNVLREGGTLCQVAKWGRQRRLKTKAGQRPEAHVGCGQLLWGLVPGALSRGRGQCVGQISATERWLKSPQRWIEGSEDGGGYQAGAGGLTEVGRGQRPSGLRKEGP